tara:strand:+ start:108 stop:290 length:183 start_codon:yes stop_codon:yes gene_type:complete
MNADRNEVNTAGLCFTCAPFASFPAKIDEKQCLNESLYIRNEIEHSLESNRERREKNEAK